MTQASPLAFSFNVSEVVRLGLDGIGRGLSAGRRSQIAAQRLAEVDVLHLAGRRYDTLSGGEQRRVQFARVLAQLDAGRTIADRQALLLDAARAAAAQGAAVLAVLHDLNLAAHYADTIAVMRAGAIIACGSPGETLSSALLSTVFGLDLAVVSAGADGGRIVFPARWSALRQDGSPP